MKQNKLQSEKFNSYVLLKFYIQLWDLSIILEVENKIKKNEDNNKLIEKKLDCYLKIIYRKYNKKKMTWEWTIGF